MASQNVVNVAEQCHVACLHPIDVGGAAKSIYVNMKNWAHASVIVTSGVAANQATIKCYKSADNAASGEHTIDFVAYDAGATDVLGARTAVAADTGFLQTAAGCISVFEIDANQLDADHPYLGVKTDGAAANIISIVVVLSGGRYPGASTPTVDPS
jgi:hypothetical protein